MLSDREKVNCLIDIDKSHGVSSTTVKSSGVRRGHVNHNSDIEEEISTPPRLIK